MNKTSKNKTNTGARFFCIFRVIMFCIALGVAIFITYQVLSLKETSGDYMSSTSQLYSTDDDLIDVAFVGSSHVFTGIYPAVLWQDYGYSAFDMSISGEDINSSYHTIVELLKTQSPQVVCVDLFGLLYEGYGLEGNLLRNALAMKLSSNGYEFLKDIVPEKDIMKYLFRFPIIHTRYRELTKYDFITRPLNKYARGEVYLNNCMSFTMDSFDESKTNDICELSEAHREWIDSLVELADLSGFKLVLYVTPFEITYEQQTIINSAIQYAENRGIDCCDFNKQIEELSVDSMTDFTDKGHLNYLGAYKLTSWFGEWLEENANLVDHRGDMRYWQWMDDEHAYSNYLDSYHMKASGELKDILSIATTNSDMITVLSIDFVSFENVDSYKETLNNIGITDNDIYDGGMWIYKEGSWTKVLANEGELPPYYLYISESDALRLHYDAFLSPTNISIGIENYNNYGYNVTLLCYDTFLEQVSYSGGQ